VNEGEKACSSGRYRNLNEPGVFCKIRGIVARRAGRGPDIGRTTGPKKSGREEITEGGSSSGTPSFIVNVIGGKKNGFLTPPSEQKEYEPTDGEAYYRRKEECSLVFL